ncbi:hypothetical protein [Nocardioides alkalitolerans]|uniref:hypothetical protein n=1 Tax=Nocardioides alkalitolerans TaxID=281714 RepID=UPI000A05D480|nr:hypothetical protein [Nocardioides alkalitolerans]
MGKIQDETEVRRWFEQGKTYRWMTEEYARRYNIQISPSAFSNLRIKRGWEPRYVWEGELIPWDVATKHSRAHANNMLRAERRRRAGHELTTIVQAQLDTWKRGLADVDGVVHYDPETEQGFFIVARREGIDADLVRDPKHRD